MSQKTADDVLGVLFDRKGFDNWWGSIGPDNRDRIREELNRLLRDEESEYRQYVSDRLDNAGR